MPREAMVPAVPVAKLPEPSMDLTTGRYVLDGTTYRWEPAEPEFPWLPLTSGS